LLYIAFDDHLVVTDEDRYCAGTFAPLLPQKHQRKLQTIGSGTLDRSVETVGQLLDVHAAPAG
jgi:hypothetical protein